MLKTRVIAALVFAPALLALVFVGGTPLAICCAGLSALMLWESLRLLVPAQSALWPIALAAWLAASLLLGAQFVFELRAWLPLAWPGMMVLILSGALFARGTPAQIVTAASGALLAVGYSCALIPTLYLLRARQADGLYLALVALFCTWGADTGAYFAGRALGRHKLAPGISPGKTREGAVGGLVLALCVALGLRACLHVSLPIGHAAVLGLLAAVAGIAGDLAESLLKRAAGAKDSSQIIPGHGGVLDRFDGVLFACWSVYLYAQLFLSQKGL